MRVFVVSAVAALCALASDSMADERARKTLTASAYQMWNHIDYSSMSNDGRWVVYTLRSGSGANELIVRATSGHTEFRVPRGKVASYGSRLPKASIAGDSGSVLFGIELDGEPGSLLSQRNSQRATRSLGVLSLPDGTLTRIENVASFVLPKDSGQYMAYRPDSEASGQAAGTLVVRDLSRETDVRIKDVSEFVFDDRGRYIAYAVEGATPEHNGVYVRRLADGQVHTLLSGEGRYRSLAFAADGMQLAFLSDYGSRERTPAPYSVYYAASPTSRAIPVVAAVALDVGREVSRRKGVAFTQAGNALIFYTSARQEVAADHGPAQETARLSLRSWQDPWRYDDFDPKRRRKTYEGASNAPEYLAIYHIGQGRWVQLGNESNPEVLLTGDASRAVGVREHVWNEGRALLGAAAIWTADVSVINVNSGKAELALPSLQALLPGLRGLERRKASRCPTTADLECRYLSLSPGGRYALYFAERRWWSLDLANSKRVDLTGKLLPKIPFGPIGSGAPISQSYASSWGHVPPVAGWAADDRRVYLYDAYDLWALDPAGRDAPRNLTRGAGRKANITFRLLRDVEFTLDDGWGGLSGPQQIPDEGKSLLLYGLHQNTMASGIWRMLPDGAHAPEPLLVLDKRISLARARRAEQYLLTMESYTQYPDLWTGARLDRLKRISDANPQQSEYRWGTTELVEFTSDFGVSLRGILYKPEGFDASRKYPMVVSIYEVENQSLHHYVSPAPLASSPVGGHAWPEAVSQGYVVFMPDILPVTPYPMQAAVAAVIPAVQSIVDRGFVDAERIALTGHSYGAYQAGYIVTQTNLFRCAIIDSGATNTISYRGTAPFGTGFTELGQFRHGGSLWERPFVYLANSTVLYANRVQTPVLMMHTNEDTAVPVEQGLDLFAALHRNGKEVYYARYDGERHGLSGLANRLDWNDRVTAFLDHFMKEGPRPSWMSPYPDRAETVSRVYRAVAEQ